MVTETITDKFERYKALAKIFLKNDVAAAIKDSENNYYFCRILFVGEEKIRIHCFGPPHRSGEKFDLYYPLIIKFEEYKEGKK